MNDWMPGPGWLFCPADRPDRYAKALSRADIVILDLEDAVSAAEKATARRILADLASSDRLDRERTVVRISSLRTQDGIADLQVAEDLQLERVMLAKTEHPGEIERIPADVIALIETARGVTAVDSIAAASNLIGIMWGAEDLVADLGGTSSRRGDRAYHEVARYARSRALIAAKSHRRLAVDAVHMDIDDLEGLRAECQSAVAVGFDATAAIHPSQVESIRACYTPSEERIDWARRLLAHVGADRKVTTFEGQMVDGPVYRQAERILGRARS